MAPVAQAQVRGTAQLQAGMRVLAANIDRAAEQDATRRVAEQASANIRGRVPRKTGRLAASVRAVKIPGGWQASMGGAGVPYARWIEYGFWGGRSGPRYVEPIAQQAGPQLRREGEAAARREIERMRWPHPR